MTALPLLEARALSSRYGPREVLRDVSLSIAGGESVAVVGPNGAGKSSLVRALLGAIPDTRGEVLLDGLPLRSLPADARARAMALVPQSTRIDLDFTARELVAMGRAPHSGGWGLESSADSRVVAEAMSRAEVSHLASRPVMALSGGERQRLLLARALAQQAPMLLLDEPTAHQDLSHQLRVMELVEAHVRGGGGAMVVLHDLSLAARLDRVLVVAEGRVLADAKPREALSTEILRTVFGVDGRLEHDGFGPVLRVRGRTQPTHTTRHP